MPFELLPALDVSEGRPVGPGERHTAAGPLEIALTWQREGAAWIHLVDLDAAFERGSNAELLASTIQQLDIDVELAGGVRDDSSLAWALSTGCRRVILSTTALVDLGWCARMIAAHRDRIAVGLDVRIVEHPDGVLLVRNHGWPEKMFGLVTGFLERVDCLVLLFVCSGFQSQISKYAVLAVNIRSR